jgi:hypothetical protein
MIFTWNSNGNQCKKGFLKGDDSIKTIRLPNVPYGAAESEGLQQ